MTYPDAFEPPPQPCLSNAARANDRLQEPPAAAAAATNAAAADPAKKLRNLRKKLRDIEALEVKLSSGEIKSPEPEQLEKVARKAQVVEDIAVLERALGGAS